MQNTTNGQKQRIGQLFDLIAKRYDMLNHLLSLGIDRRWRKTAIRCLSPHTLQVLDVAVGTADLSIAMVKHGKTQHVTGIDISDGMMAIGQRKITAAGYQEHIHLQHADVCALPFSDGTFQAVTCAFGVRNFSHLQEGLTEMFRVLAPHGQLVILEFTSPKNPIVRFFYNLYLRHILPWIGRIISKNKNAYRYLPESIHQFNAGTPFEETLQQVGFEHCISRPLTCGICTLYTAIKSK